QYPWGHLICEIRTVNHRYLEAGLRLSDALRGLEPGLREQLRNQLGRGKVDLVLAFKPDESSGLSTDFDYDLARDLVRMVEQVNQLAANPAPINALEILRWPGVLKARELEQELLETEALNLFAKTLKQL